MITAARFRAEASAAAAAAASASRLARCSRPHFIRTAHRRAAIWSLMTSSRSREYCPRASIPRTCACTSVAARRLRPSLRLCDLRRLERRLLLQPLRFQAFPLSSKRPPPHSHLKSPKRGEISGVPLARRLPPDSALYEGRRVRSRSLLRRRRRRLRRSPRVRVPLPFSPKSPPPRRHLRGDDGGAIRLVPSPRRRARARAPEETRRRPVSPSPPPPRAPPPPRLPSPRVDEDTSTATTTAASPVAPE